MGQPEYCEIGRANQHTGYISSHNLRMHPSAKLTKPFATDQPVFKAAVQSNKVYPPQEVLLVSTDLAWRQINAIRSKLSFSPHGYRKYQPVDKSVRR